jgi:hypothetical protein
MVLCWYGGIRYAFWEKKCGASPQPHDSMVEYEGQARSHTTVWWNMRGEVNFGWENDKMMSKSG